MDISFAEALDDLCTEIIRRGGDTPREVRVAPRLYDQVAGARRRRPLLLLGLEVIRDENVSGASFRLR